MKRHLIGCTLLIIMLLGIAPMGQSQQLTCGISMFPLILGPEADPIEVADLQAILRDLRYYQGQVDGIFSSALEGAFHQFQVAHNLASDSVVNEATWLALAGGTHNSADVISKPKPSGALRIEVDTNQLKLTLFVDDKPYKSYPIAVGRMSGFTWSPIGDWRVVNKGINWGGGFGTRWMGLNVPWGTYGIHGTNKPYSIGSRASHGCIRMFNKDVEELYSWVSVGTQVSIVGRTPKIKLRNTLRVGDTGQDVVQVQQHLQALGIQVAADGRYGPQTQAYIQQLQQLYGLPADGTIYSDMYYLLGLK